MIERKVRLPKLSRDDALDAYNAAVAVFEQYHVDSEDCDTLWRALRNFTLFVLAERGEMAEPPGDEFSREELLELYEESCAVSGTSHSW